MELLFLTFRSFHDGNGRDGPRSSSSVNRIMEVRVSDSRKIPADSAGRFPTRALLLRSGFPNHQQKVAERAAIPSNCLSTEVGLPRFLSPDGVNRRNIEICCVGDPYQSRYPFEPFNRYDALTRSEAPIRTPATMIEGFRIAAHARMADNASGRRLPDVRRETGGAVFGHAERPSQLLERAFPRGARPDSPGQPRGLARVGAHCRHHEDGSGGDVSGRPVRPRQGLRVPRHRQRGLHPQEVRHRPGYDRRQDRRGHRRAGDPPDPAQARRDGAPSRT